MGDESPATLDGTNHGLGGHAELATKDPSEPFTRISVSEAKEKLDKGEAVMVDVREPNEYVEVHAKDVRLIPVNTVIGEVKQIREYAKRQRSALHLQVGAAERARGGVRDSGRAGRRAAVQRRGRHDGVGRRRVPNGGLALTPGAPVSRLATQDEFVAQRRRGSYFDGRRGAADRFDRSVNKS